MTKVDYKPIVISLPIADRPTSFRFYRDALRLEPIGEPVEDGVPEPLQFVINGGLHLMLVPTGGFGWVIGNHKVAPHDVSECILSIEMPSSAGVDELLQQAEAAGAKIITEPTQQDWGYTGSFSDPDGHIWMILSA
jgi:uncharacterized protein